MKYLGIWQRVFRGMVEVTGIEPVSARHLLSDATCLVLALFERGGLQGQSPSRSFSEDLSLLFRKKIKGRGG